MQKHRQTVVLVILALGCTLVSNTIFAGAYSQIIQKVLATNTTSTSVQPTNGSDIILGTPQTYTEYEQHYFAGFKPIIVNGTHEIEQSFAGHEIQNGSTVATHGQIFITNSTAGSGLQTVVGYNIVHGNTLIFRGINHVGADGKIRDIGVVEIPSKGVVGIYKGDIDKNGNAITKIWFWK